MALRIDIVTAFPGMMTEALSHSIPGRASKKGLVEIVPADLRTFTYDKYKTIDDAPYGGGGGMVLKVQPIFECIENLLKAPEITAKNHIREFLPPSTEVIMTSPQGEPFTQALAVELSLKSRLVFLCGHYKGIDERVHERLITRTISIGDFVLSGGEIAALAMIDSIVRLSPGAIGDAQSALTDSFQNDILDCDYYTRPEDFRGMTVPKVLLEGNHLEISKWREARRIERTKKLRPDLFDKDI